MSLKTVWGYELTDVNSLPPMLTMAEYNALTAGKYTGDVRISPNLDAAGTAIRNYCGWHVFPSLSCRFAERLLFGNGRIKSVYDNFIIQLPATFVSEITSVTIGGEEFSDYALESNGVVHLFDVPQHRINKRTEIVIDYVAGLHPEMMDAVKELVAHRITHALARSEGVQSETAGGVSITYSASWLNNTGAGSLADNNKEILQPYRLEGVF